MARRTAQEIVNEIALNIGDEEHDKITEAGLLRYANDAQNEIVLLHEPSECINTVSYSTVAAQRDYVGGEEITIPAERPLLKVLSMFDHTNGFRMIEVDDAWYRTIIQGGIDSGKPTHWYSFASVGYFRLWPTPDDAYAIYFAYLHLPTGLVLSPVPNNLTLLEAWDDVVIAMATARAFRRIQEWEAANHWKREAMELTGRVRFAVTTLNSEPWAIGSPRIGREF